jgi:hypothetical protein
MSVVYIECPSCNWEDRVDETLVGKKIKCGKCGASFVAEVGGTYDLAETKPARPGAPTPRPPRASGPAHSDREEPSPADDAPDGEQPKSWLDLWPSD